MVTVCVQKNNDCGTGSVHHNSVEGDDDTNGTSVDRCVRSAIRSAKIPVKHVLFLN